MKKLLLLLTTFLGIAQIKAASSLEEIERRLNENEQVLNALYAKVSASRQAQITATQKPAKRVHFNLTAQVKKLPTPRTMDAILQYGFARKTTKLWSYEGQAFLKDKRNVSQDLLDLLNHGHPLYVFKRNLRHIPKREIIQSLECYLRCNRNTKLEELLKVLKIGNYYEL